MQPQAPLFSTPEDEIQPLVEALGLTDDQHHLLKVIAKNQRARLLAQGRELWNDRSQPKERFNQARALAGMAEGVVHLVALLVGDVSIADDPDGNL